jgi:MFS family permease
VTFRDALRGREFRAVWLAELLSIGGDQLARVALAWIVFGRTSSATLTAATYALTFIPSIVGGAALSGLADRYPRRAVLVATDSVRAVLVAMMALPGVPVPLLWVLVAAVSAAAGPFKAAQGALLPVVLPDAQFQAGVTLRQISTQIAQAVGFGGAGVALALIGPSWCLLLDAVTFAASAVFVRAAVAARPAAAKTAVSAIAQREIKRGRSGALVLVFGLAVVVGVCIVQEGVAVPYAHGLHASAVGVGLLMAADPVGSVIGAWLTKRWRVQATPRAMVGCAAAAGLPLVACGARPDLAVSVVLWAVCGAFATSLLVQATILVRDTVPDHRRGRISGWLATVLYASQGIAILAGGLATDVIGPFRAVAGGGVVGVGLSLVVLVVWRVARSRTTAMAGRPSLSDVVGQ